MSTYVAKMQIDNNEAMPIGPTLFGTCSSSRTLTTKRVVLSSFDNLVHGVTIWVKFLYGNNLSSGIKLQVADTLAYDIVGDCTCNENDVIAFTFDEVNATTKYWRANTCGISPKMKEYITNAINTSTDTPDVLLLKGTVGFGGNPGLIPTSDYEVGWTYRVISDGTYANHQCSAGDLMIAIANSTAGQSAANENHWIVIQSKLYDVVKGPSTNVQNNHIVTFDGTTGRLVQDSGYTIETSVPANAVFIDTTYTNGTGLNLSNNTFSVEYGNTAGTAAQGNDPRLSDARTPLSHTHGNITNDGKIGSGNALLRTTDGEINIGPLLGNDATKFLNNRGEWAITGNVTGPVSSTADHIAIFDDATGKILADSGFTIGISVPANAVFTDTTYTVNENGLSLSEQNVISIVYGNTAGTVVEGNDSRLSDARAPLSHTHGNITNDGYLGEGNALLRTSGGEIVAGPAIGNNAALFLNNTGAWTTPPYPVTSVNGKTGDVVLTASDLGIGVSMHFIGSVDPSSTYQPSDGTAPTGSEVLIITGLSTYIPEPGDIIIDRYENQEYIYTAAHMWEALGSDEQYKVVQTAITKPTAVTNKWVSAIGQNANGEITVEYEFLDTTGTWSGNAATASTLQTARELYVNLEITRNSQNPRTFDGSAALSLSVDGILPIEHGGTGTDTFAQNQVLLTNNVSGENTASAFITRAYLDRTSATPLSTSNNFITERSIHYGLPQINDEHDYDSTYTYYAPITSGARYQILVSGTRTEGQDSVTDPEWAAAALIESDVTTTHTTVLTLGNNATTGSASDGKIKIYSTGSGYHLIDGASTSSNYTHTLPNQSGIILQTAFGATGSNTEPVYIDADGIAQALTYTVNRLYYSASTTSFEATGHYASSTQIGINITAWPQNNTDKLYVYGNSTLDGTLVVTDTTTLTGNVGVGAAPESGNDAHLLFVDGSSHLDGAVDISGITHITNSTIATSSTGALLVDGGISVGENLYVTDTASILEAVGIGTTYDSNETYILTINGSTRIMNSNAVAAYLALTTQTVGATTVDTLNFYPETDTTGSIGLSSYRWGTGYFSTLLSVGTTGDGVLIEKNNILISATASQTSNTINLTTLNGHSAATLTSDTSSITLDTTASTGSITITTLVPTIILDTTTANSNSWTFTNTAGTFTLEDGTASLQGTSDGWEFTGNVGINITPEAAPTVSTTDPHVLIINGSALFANSTDYAAHMDMISELIGVNTYTVMQFYPGVDKTGTIGIPTNRWGSGYFTNSITIDNDTSGITLSATTGTITVSTATPTIALTTTTTGATNWSITNTSGTFAISNGSTVSITGTDDGFALASKLYINDAPTSGSTLDLYVNGTSELLGAIGLGAAPQNSYQLYVEGNSQFKGNLIPQATNTYSLGNSTLRWSTLYVGTADSYGDAYTPVYWSNGIPVTTTVVQKASFTIASGATSCTITKTNVYTSDTIVLQIVVTSGYSNLCAPITSVSAANTITLSTATATTGIVSGYIVTARGAEI